MNTLSPIPFFVPLIEDEDLASVAAVLKSGHLTSGKEVALFEQEFSAYLGERSLNTVAVNSATAGLHLCLDAYGIGSGDEVIVPTLTFTATAEVVIRMGAVPVFVDIDINTFCIDLDHVEKLITPRTKAIIPVHHSGRACDIDRLIKIASQHGLIVIEDAAHALPATYKSRKIGTLDTHATVFSFYANKTMTTGDGGIIVTRDCSIGDRCRLLRLHGICYATDPTILKSGCLYDIATAGYKYNMTDIAAGLGRVQLRKLEKMHDRRRDAVMLYYKLLQGSGLVLPLAEDPDCIHSWHLFIIRFEGSDSHEKRTRAIRIFRENSIGYGIHYRPLHQHSFWKSYATNAKSSFKNANLFYKTCLSLPLYPAIHEENIRRICAILRGV